MPLKLPLHPQKFSKNNAQNRDTVKRSKEDSEAISSIALDVDGIEVADEPEPTIMDEADMYAAESDSSDLAYVASDYVGEIDYEDFADHFASSSIGALPTDNMEEDDELPLAQLDGALTDGVSSDSDDEEKGEPASVVFPIPLVTMPTFPGP